jgi:hypothetical protein
MKRVLAELAGLLAIFVLAASLLNARESNRTARTLIGQWQAKYAEAATRADATADTVIQTVTKTRTLRDTLNITDTVQIREYITQTDTLLLRCEQCAKQLQTLRRIADSTIYVLRQELNRATNKERFWKRCGVFAGYGISGGENESLRRGPQIGIGCRAFP